MNIDKYLYETIDDYKNCESVEERDDIFKSFCSSIWSCNNKRKVMTKTIRFNVRKDLLKTDIGMIFDVWSEIEYKGYKSMTRNTEWYNLIRQKINNLYTRYFDKDVILKKDYMYELGTPKRLYFQWVDGVEMYPDSLTTLIDDSIDKAIMLKSTYQKQKIDLTWDEYKDIVEEFLHRAINNCRLIEDYEDKTKIVNMYDFMNEDNFYIKYFCKCLEGEMRKWQKRHYELPQNTRKGYKRCQVCGKLIEKTSKNDYSSKYCNACRIENRKKRNHIYYIKTKPKS